MLSNLAAAAYLAAFIDGEGHIGCHPTSRGYFTRSIAFCNTEKALIDAVLAICRQLGFQPALYNSKLPPNPNWSPRWTVYVARKRADIELFARTIPIQSPAKYAALQKLLCTYVDPEETRKRRRNGCVTSCETCGSQIYVTPAIRARGGGRFCSRKCRGLAQRTFKEIECINCRKTFQRKPARRDIYCGQACYHEHQDRRIAAQAEMAARARWKLSRPPSASRP